MKGQGFYYTLDEEKIIEYSKLTAEQKLIWLEEIMNFTNSLLTEKERKFRDLLREGRI